MGLVDVTALTAGAAHTCARTADGFAVCWGDGRFGQLGGGEAAGEPVAVPRSALDGELPVTIEVAERETLTDRTRQDAVPPILRPGPLPDDDVVPVVVLVAGGQLGLQGMQFSDVA